MEDNVKPEANLQFSGRFGRGVWTKSLEGNLHHVRSEMDISVDNCIRLFAQEKNLPPETVLDYMALRIGAAQKISEEKEERLKGFRHPVEKLDDFMLSGLYRDPKWIILTQNSEIDRFLMKNGFVSFHGESGQDDGKVALRSEMVETGKSMAERNSELLLWAISGYKGKGRLPDEFRKSESPSLTFADYLRRRKIRVPQTNSINPYVHLEPKIAPQIIAQPVEDKIIGHSVSLGQDKAEAVQTSTDKSPQELVEYFEEKIDQLGTVFGVVHQMRENLSDLRQQLNTIDTGAGESAGKQMEAIIAEVQRIANRARAVDELANSIHIDE